MKFTFLTLFPELIEPYFGASIMRLAREKGLISVEAVNLRDYAFCRHKKVDAPPISGGAGQVLRADVLANAILDVLETADSSAETPTNRHCERSAERGARQSHNNNEESSAVIASDAQHRVAINNADSTKRAESPNIRHCERSAEREARQSHNNNEESSAVIASDAQHRVAINSAEQRRYTKDGFDKWIATPLASPTARNDDSAAHSNTTRNNTSTNNTKSPKKPRVIFLTPCAPAFTSVDAKRLATTQSHIVLVCGRYEGFDERAIEGLADEVFSVGDFIISGGELAALCVADAVARHIKGVLGNEESLLGESFENDILEAPNFARESILDSQNLAKNAKIPKNLSKIAKIFQKYPPILDYSKGNHARIASLKHKLGSLKAKYFRPEGAKND